MVEGRDPERIDRMVELLREMWHLVPQWRLTQLVINATDTDHNCGPVFYIEDEEMEKRLMAAIAGLKKSP